MIALIRSLIAVFLFCPVAFAANHYIRDGATGSTCADWGDNACDALPATLVRGDTYYIADGSYGAYTYNDAESGSTYITIKKATASDHGSETGWLSSYGDGIAEFTGVQEFNVSYMEVNGGETLGTYGFQTVTDGTWDSGWYPILIRNGSNLQYIKIIGWYIRADGGNNAACIKAQSSANGSRFTIRNCKFINYNDAISLDTNGYNTYEYNYFERSDGEAHGDAIVAGTIDDYATDQVIRYNIFNWCGQMIFFNGGAVSTFVHNNIEVYGNIFYCDGSVTASTCPLHQNSSRSDVTNLKAYNNTMYKVYYGIHMGGDGAHTGTYKNNLIYDASSSPNFGDLTHSYNYWETGVSISETGVQNGGDLFVDSTNWDLRLSAATNAGDNSIGETYNTDRLGKTRGNDGSWDRGAYEYDASRSARGASFGAGGGSFR